MLAALWVSMMVVWLGGLVWGVWWVWPHLKPLSMTADFVFSLSWLVVGATAWLVALNFGYQRFWRR